MEIISALICGCICGLGYYFIGSKVSNDSKYYIGCTFGMIGFAVMQVINKHFA